MLAGNSVLLARRGWTNLEQWRLWGNLIEVNKTMRGIDWVDSQNLSLAWNC